MFIKCNHSQCSISCMCRGCLLYLGHYFLLLLPLSLLFIPLHSLQNEESLGRFLCLVTDISDILNTVCEREKGRLYVVYGDMCVQVCMPNCTQRG